MGTLQLHDIGGLRKALAGVSVWATGGKGWLAKLLHGRPQLSWMLQIPGHLCWRRLSHRVPARLAVFFKIYGQWPLQNVLPFQSTTWGCTIYFMSRMWGGVLFVTSPTYYSTWSAALFPSSSPCFPPSLSCLYRLSHTFAVGAIKKKKS